MSHTYEEFLEEIGIAINSNSFEICKQLKSKKNEYKALMTSQNSEEENEKLEKRILSGCKIPGCIIHAIDKEGNILEHYQTEDDIPEALQEGYQVYLQHKGCFFG